MNKEVLVNLIKQRALRLGDFTLKSGQKSKFYLDCRAIALSPALAEIIPHFRHLLDDIEFDAIGGPCVGADPIVGAYLHSQYDERPDLRGFLVRKESKDYGLDGLVIGSVQPGDRCVMIEDVTTTASSMLTAVNAVRAFGASVVMGVALVDRSGGEAGKLLGKNRIPFRSILTLEDLGL